MTSVDEFLLNAERPAGKREGERRGEMKINPVLQHAQRSGNDRLQKVAQLFLSTGRIDR